MDEESAVAKEIPATEVKELVAEAEANTSVLAPAAVIAPFELVILISPVTTVELLPPSVNVTLVAKLVPVETVAVWLLAAPIANPEMEIFSPAFDFRVITDLSVPSKEAVMNVLPDNPLIAADNAVKSDVEVIVAETLWLFRLKLTAPGALRPDNLATELAVALTPTAPALSLIAFAISLADASGHENHENPSCDETCSAAGLCTQNNNGHGATTGPKYDT